MWELDNKKNWVLKNWCLQTVVLEKTLETALDSKEIKPVNPKGSQPWIFIGRTDAETETPIPWPPDSKSQLIGKDPDAGKDWRQEEKGWQRMRWLDGITDSTDMSLSNSGRWWRTGRPGVLQSMGPHRIGRDWATEQQQRNAQGTVSVYVRKSRELRYVRKSRELRYVRKGRELR